MTFCTGTYLQHIWTRQSDYPFACHKTWVSHPILSKAVYRAKNRIHIQYPNAKDRGKLIILSLLFQPDTTAEEFVKQSCKRGARNVYCIEDWNAIVSSTFTPTIAMEYRVGKLKFLLLAIPKSLWLQNISNCHFSPCMYSICTVNYIYATFFRTALKHFRPHLHAQQSVKM